MLWTFQSSIFAPGRLWKKSLWNLNMLQDICCCQLAVDWLLLLLLGQQNSVNWLAWINTHRSKMSIHNPLYLFYRLRPFNTQNRWRQSFHHDLRHHWHPHWTGDVQLHWWALQLLLLHDYQQVQKNVESQTGRDHWDGLDLHRIHLDCHYIYFRGSCFLLLWR